jgi:glycosyltransferase involved in cell wall biosynthesis
MAKLDILTTDGSPTTICPECLYGDEYRFGVGGSELYLITLCEEWVNQGHQVRLYNDPHKVTDKLEQLPIRAFDPQENRDVLVNFRTPNSMSIEAKGLKTWLSCDQYSRGDYKAFAPHMDKIICISQTHVDFFKKHYGIENAFYIDIPIREKDFIDIEKIPNRLIFTSVPTRGLAQLRKIYPFILEEIPDVSLVITSDFRLWGASAQNEQYRIDWIKYLGSAQFRGALSRRKYIEELCKADVFIYPSTYQELFCISCSEAQWAGAYPITSSTGALSTTNMGTVIDLHPDTSDGIKQYVDKTVELLSNRERLKTLQDEVRCKARERFSLHKIMKEWEKVFNE